MTSSQHSPYLWILLLLLDIKHKRPPSRPHGRVEHKARFILDQALYSERYIKSSTSFFYIPLYQHKIIILPPRTPCLSSSGWLYVRAAFGRVDDCAMGRLTGRVDVDAIWRAKGGGKRAWLAFFLCELTICSPCHAAALSSANRPGLFWRCGGRRVGLGGGERRYISISFHFISPLICRAFRDGDMRVPEGRCEKCPNLRTKQ